MTPLQTIASSITKAASQQTYYTIRFLADRERAPDAYRAYAYFRWVDDTLDAGPNSAQDRITFLERQKYLLEKCYRIGSVQDAALEEKMLIELVQHDHEKNSGLQSYLRNMMHVMELDAKRRGRWISQAELNDYTRWLASAVTEAMHYFIGYGEYSPHDETRYLAVTGAHISHMLRDAFEDVQAGYYNIPREVLEAGHMQPFETAKQGLSRLGTGPGAVGTRMFQSWKRLPGSCGKSTLQAGRPGLYRPFRMVVGYH